MTLRYVSSYVEGSDSSESLRRSKVFVPICMYEVTYVPKLDGITPQISHATISPLTIAKNLFQRRTQAEVREYFRHTLVLT